MMSIELEVLQLLIAILFMGIHIEVHCQPEKSLSDGPQALLPEQYTAVMKQIRSLTELFGKTIPAPSGTSV